MASILLVNPHRRGAKKVAKRKRAKRKTTHRRASRRHTNPSRRRAHRRYANPHRRARRRNPHRRVARRRRNPSLLGGMGGGFIGNLKTGVKGGLTGAIGALGLDLAWGYGSKYLPASLNVGMVQYLSKAIGAVLVGMLGSKLMPGKGADLTRGAMTVILHDALKSTLQSAVPSLPLGAYVGTSPIVAYGAPAVGHPQLGTGLGAYPGNSGTYSLMRTNAVPSASNMGAYVGGYIDGTEGTDWG